MYTKPGIDRQTGRPDDYQLFTITTFHFTKVMTYHYLGRRRRRKGLKHTSARYDEVFRNGLYVIAEHQQLKGRFVETLDDDNWRHVPSWKGTYEVPKCICTKRPEG